MTMRRQGALVLGVVLLVTAAACGKTGGLKTDRIGGPPKDARYLGLAVLLNDTTVVKSERVAAKNGAPVDFYLLNLTDVGWKATVSFPRIPAGITICKGGSNITGVAIEPFADKTGRCILDKDEVERYCGSRAAAAEAPPAAPAADAAPTATSAPAVATAAATWSVCEVEYSITFTSDQGGKKIVDPRLEIER